MIYHGDNDSSLQTAREMLESSWMAVLLAKLMVTPGTAAVQRSKKMESLPLHWDPMGMYLEPSRTIIYTQVSGSSHVH